MNRILKDNQSVIHHKFGSGIVIAERNQGFERLVRFDDGRESWLRSDQLIFPSSDEILIDFTISDMVKHQVYGVGEVVAIDEDKDERDFKITVRYENEQKTFKQRYARLVKYDGPQTQTIKIPNEPFIKSDEETKESVARRAIEAFRFGIVPMLNVEEFTVGRDNEVNKIKNFLNDPKQSVLLVIGNYGTGKTHLMQYTALRALHDGLAVAKISIDTRENPFHKPKRVYSKLIESFTFPSKRNSRPENFRELLKEANELGVLQSHNYLRHIGDCSDHLMLDWIEARESISRPVKSPYEGGYQYNVYHDIPPLYDYTTAANIYSNILSGIGWICKTKLGLKGLVLIFDESESFDRAYYQYQNERSLNFIEALVRVAKNDPELLKPANETNLEYCGRQNAAEIPFLYKIPSGIKCVFSLTDPEICRVLPVFEDVQILELDNLQIDVLHEIIKKISDFYKSAYKLEQKIPHETVLSLVQGKMKLLPSGSRRLVKASVEALDLLRFSNHKSGGFV